MSANFPTNRNEAGLGSGALQQGDQFIYNSIAYTWVLSPDGTSGAWSSKGINVNPDLYIAKNEDFNVNAGVISGSYSGNPFSVSSAGNAAQLNNLDPSHYLDVSNATGELNKARLPASIDANTTGSAASATNASQLNNQLPSHYLNASNIDAGTLNASRLPSQINVANQGSAATAGTADKVANALTINYYGAGLVPGTNPPTTTITYDGEFSKSINIVDTDEATVVLPFTAGTGLNINSSDKININQNIARTVSSSGLYVVNGRTDSNGDLDPQYLKVQLADSASNFGTDANGNLLPPSHYLDRIADLENAPTPAAGKTYAGDSSTIEINTDTTPNQISAAKNIARGADINFDNFKAGAQYVCKIGANGNNAFLKAYEAHNAVQLNGVAADKYATKTYVSDEIDKIETNPDTGTPSLQDVINQDSVVDSNAIIYLQNSNGNNKVTLNGSDGGINLRHTGGTPNSIGGYIDFGDREADATGRIYYQNGNLNVKVPNQNNGDPFTLKPSTTTIINNPGTTVEGGGAVDSVNDQTGTVSLSLGDLSNVNVSSASQGQVLKYNGSQWYAGTDEVGSSTGGGSGDELGQVFSLNDFTGSDTFRLQSALNAALRAANDMEDRPGVYIPAGTWNIGNVTLGSKASKSQISIFGNGGQGSSSNLVFTGQFRIEHPVNINSITFDFGSSSMNGASGLLFRRPDLMGNAKNPNDPTKFADGQRQDDMDSSITQCLFMANKASGSMCIDYRGRNCLIDGNRFVTGDQSNAIGLSYYDNRNEPKESQDIYGWKRIHITNNNFHNWTETAVVVYPAGIGKEGKFTASGPIVNGEEDTGPAPVINQSVPSGFIIANNSVETQGSLIRFLSLQVNGSGQSYDCKPEACTFSSNTNVNKSGPHNFISFTSSGCSYCSFTGNVVHGVTAKGKFMSIEGGENNAIVGNVAKNCRPSTFNCNKSIISGNVMDYSSGGSGNKHNDLNIKL